MQLEKVLLVLSLVSAGDAGVRELPPQRLHSVHLPALPPVARKPPRADLAELSRFPVEAELAIDRRVEDALGRGDVPGCVVIIGRQDGVVFRRAYGFAEIEPGRRPMRPDAVFDLASVTKAVATATSVAALVERGRLHYDDPVSHWLGAFRAPDKRDITLRQLLTHTSGLPPVIDVRSFTRGREAAVRSIAATRLSSAPGERYLYSDLGFIVLGEVIERASGERLDRFARETLYAPLGLSSTGFLPGPELVPRAAPTEWVDGAMLRGTVHDPRARALGVTGHAGLFSSADDLARFARMLLGRGQLDGVRVLAPSTVAAMIHEQPVNGARVALGWDLPDDPDHSAFSRRSFGHEGFTGTSLWIDPERDRFVVFLSNRVHPSGHGRAGPLAQAIRALAAPALAHLDREHDAGIGAGVDRLRSEGFQPLAGHRILLLTHDAARARDGVRTADVLFQSPRVHVVGLLSPEHGLSASGEARVGDSRDPRTGLVVESLYGPRSEPSQKLLSQVDTIVVDLQDVGARFYTYASTLLAVLRSAARHGKRVVVLDRPNPLGDAVEGPVSARAPRSFIDPFPLPVRHGMTIGELGRMFVGELSLAVDLEVVPLIGWPRRAHFGETGLRWFPPSPNLPSPDAALLYPGIALLEATNLSVGRGTATPFQLVGAPWLRPERLRDLLRAKGVKTKAVAFVPDKGPYRGELCRGLAFEVLDEGSFQPVAFGLALARALHAGFPEWETSRMAPLLGDQEVLAAIESDAPLEAIERLIRPGLARFADVRSRYLLYAPGAGSIRAYGASNL